MYSILKINLKTFCVIFIWLIIGLQKHSACLSSYRGSFPPNLSKTNVRYGAWIKHFPLKPVEKAKDSLTGQEGIWQRTLSQRHGASTWGCHICLGTPKKHQHFFWCDLNQVPWYLVCRPHRESDPFHTDKSLLAAPLAQNTPDHIICTVEQGHLRRLVHSVI